MKKTIVLGWVVIWRLILLFVIAPWVCVGFYMLLLVAAGWNWIDAANALMELAQADGDARGTLFRQLYLVFFLTVLGFFGAFVPEFFSKPKEGELKAIELVMKKSARGVHKRIDENRELLELLQQRAPEFLRENFWVEGWLRGQDMFLNDLLRALPIPNPLESKQFPRPWPGNTQPPSMDPR